MNLQKKNPSNSCNQGDLVIYEIPLVKFFALIGISEENYAVFLKNYYPSFNEEKETALVHYVFEYGNTPYGSGKVRGVGVNIRRMAISNTYEKDLKYKEVNHMSAIEIFPTDNCQLSSFRSAETLRDKYQQFLNTLRNKEQALLIIQLIMAPLMLNSNKMLLLDVHTDLHNDESFISLFSDLLEQNKKLHVDYTSPNNTNMTMCMYETSEYKKSIRDMILKVAGPVELTDGFAGYEKKWIYHKVFGVEPYYLLR